MLDSMTTALPTLQLKLGARVMLTKNLDVRAGLVNGAQGLITDFSGQGLHPVVEVMCHMLSNCSYV